jgi:hypothetical protein
VETCAYPGCDEPADEVVEYCYRHEEMRIAGPQLGVGPPGAEVGDLLPDIPSVTVEDYVKTFQGTSVSQRELGEQVSTLLERWDPDNAVSLPERVQLIEQLIGWLPWAELTQPFDVEVPPELKAVQQQTVGVWVSEGVHFAAADAARTLVEIAVVPALALVAGDASGRGAVLVSGAMLIGKFKTLCRHLTVLDDPDERVAYEAVHAESWDIRRAADGVRRPFERGAGAADVAARIRLDKEDVERILRHLRERGILRSAADRWYVAF